MIYTILAWLMPTKTVDKAVAALTKFTQALVEAELVQTERAIKLRDQAGALLKQADVADLEAERAARVRDKIIDLTA